MTEDFLGDISVTEEAEIYRPIFFGTDEGRLEICGPAGEPKLMDLRFHIMSEKIIMTSLVGRDISVWSLGAGELSPVLGAVMNLPDEEAEGSAEGIELQDAIKVYVASFGSVEGFSGRGVWYETDDVLFKANDGGGSRQVPAQTVISEITDLFLRR